MDPIAAYTGKAKEYAAFRLPYSPESIETISAACGLDLNWRVADIGSGTGALTELLVDCVGHIYAVEPNEDMRREAQPISSQNSIVEHVAGMAENTRLPDNSIDLITVGQALHWFDPVPARREFSRILKTEGWLVAVWNQFKTAEVPDITNFFCAGSIQRMSFPMTIQETWDEFIGGTRTAAASPQIDDPAYPEFEKNQRALFESQSIDGVITVTYITEIAVGKLNT